MNDEVFGQSVMAGVRIPHRLDDAEVVERGVGVVRVAVTLLGVVGSAEVVGPIRQWFDLFAKELAARRRVGWRRVLGLHSRIAYETRSGSVRKPTLLVKTVRISIPTFGLHQCPLSMTMSFSCRSSEAPRRLGTRKSG
jgi:hypothetical protein